jgi:S-disulfanyl-L-cysteine oxidoreductase SoxD
LLLLAALQAQTAKPTPPASSSRSVRDGVYTEKQAQRGAGLYHEICSNCHGDRLTGKPDEDIPALTGHDFAANWPGRPVGDLYKKIRRTMPQDDPGRLTPQQSVDATAFILSFNKFPPGEAELTADEKELSEIRIEAAKAEK